MPVPDEKTAFSQRLKQALKRSPKKIGAATELALQFNLRHPNDPITTQAAQKWLTGKARPTIDKIETLAEWLNVSAQWLRHGIAEDRPQTNSGRKSLGRKALPMLEPTTEELRLLVRLRSLPEVKSNLVYEIVEQFALEQEMWKS